MLNTNPLPAECANPTVRNGQMKCTEIGARIWCEKFIKREECQIESELKRTTLLQMRKQFIQAYEVSTKDPKYSDYLDS